MDELKTEGSASSAVYLPDAPKKKKKKKKHARRSTKIFYTGLLVFVLIFVIALSFLMSALKDWLVTFEASQPTAKCNQVFESLFSAPDWQSLYTMAGETETGTVTAESFAAYMEEKIGDTQLSCIETSAGLSGDKKYIVRCGNEKVATFTLTNTTPENTVPTWELGTVEVFYSCDLSVNIITTPGNTVLVNGQELDESHVIRKDSTKAEDYLPEGVHGYQLWEMKVDGLLAEPKVEILGKSGAPVELSYDADTRTYSHAIPGQKQLTEADGEYQTLMGAAKTYCEYMIGKVGKADLSRCFDANTEIYDTITSNTTWMQKFSSYHFDTEAIDGFYRYSDTLYSAKVHLLLKVVRKDGTVKEYELNNTFFVENKGANQWMVTNMINADAQEPERTVRLTYVQGGEVLSSDWVDAHSLRLTPPAVTVPKGKTFAGWFTEGTDAEGKTVMELVFLPGADGSVTLSPDTTLEPMTLQALFE